MNRLERYGNHIRTAPWSNWLVVVMAVGVATYRYPTYNPSPPLMLYVLGTGSLILGFTLGARWAFVFCFLSAWIFPLETIMAIKGALHGWTLTALQFVSLALLYHARDYYWGGFRTPRSD